MSHRKNSLRASRRGLTMSELLVAMFIMLIIMVGIAGLLESSWQSFSDLKWQNRVDSEARRALDAICDSVRSSGPQIDRYEDLTKQSTGSANIYTDSSEIELKLLNDFADDYYVVSDQISPPYLASYHYGQNGLDMKAIYISDVHFAYEYRQASTPNNPQWTFNTVQGLTPFANSNIYFTVKTIYVTVTASYNPYPNSIDGRTYTRTLTSAVTLRAPYNAPLAPAQ